MDCLRSLPLFQGMSDADLNDIAHSVRLDFRSIPRGAVIADAGETCRTLLFIIGGSVTATGFGEGGAYTVAEHVMSPCLIEPERLFGLDQHYLRRYVALTPCKTLALRKLDVTRLMGERLVFRFGVLNLLSTLAAVRANRALQPCRSDMRGRLVDFFRDRCLLPDGHKTFHITQRQLASEVCSTRREVAAVLHALVSENVIISRRGIIDIPEMGLLTHARRNFS